ncbi:hypothetical protein [Cryobacterium breve]|uniref:hypothetical protein n=1 Tax=Cryobacterium breve TaxID=1259258 RepID=UPI00248B485C|nr:hypothetical protein [Cryobacterium breve]
MPYSTYGLLIRLLEGGVLPLLAAGDPDHPGTGAGREFVEGDVRVDQTVGGQVLCDERERGDVDLEELLHESAERCARRGSGPRGEDEFIHEPPNRVQEFRLAIVHGVLPRAVDGAVWCRLVRSVRSG